MEQKPRAVTPFQRYLDSVGDAKAAEILGVTRRAVKSWRLGDRTPRPEQARDIVAKLPVTFDDIYGASPEERAVALEKAAALLRDSQQTAAQPRRGQM